MPRILLVRHIIPHILLHCRDILHRPLLQLSLKSLVQQRLKQMLCLPRGFPLLSAEAFIFLDDLSKFLLERERWDYSNELFDISYVQMRGSRTTC